MTENNQESLITEFAFRLILDSEESEGFEFNKSTIDASGAERLKNINKEVILQFLEDPATKISISEGTMNSNHCLLASNNLYDESIKIYGIADHYITLLNMVDKARKIRKLLKENKDTPLLTHDLIKDLNLSLQTNRSGESGIGNYRSFLGDREYRILYGNIPHEVHINSYINDRYTRVTSLNLASSQNVEPLMNELVDWVNNVAFRDGRDVMKDIAEFHARFIKIHPFGDGNGRTGRLLMNYLLLVLGEQIVSIPIDDKQEYIHALNYANSENIAKSCEELNGFEDFVKQKHKENIQNGFLDYIRNKDSKKRTKNKEYSITPAELSKDEVCEILENERTNMDKYSHLAKFLRQHQVQLSSKESVKQILNNYGKKNVDEFIRIGKIRADQVDYEPVE